MRLRFTGLTGFECTSLGASFRGDGTSLETLLDRLRVSSDLGNRKALIGEVFDGVLGDLEDFGLKLRICRGSHS